VAEEQQTAAPAPSPAPAAPAPSQPAPAAAPAPSKGKSNTGLVVLIVVLVILGVLIGGGYLAYRWVKGKVTNAISENGVTTTTSDGSTVTTATSGSDDYGSSKDLTPADSFGVGVNNDIKPALATVAGGAKLNTVSSEASGAALYYLTKNTLKTSDGQSISAELQKKGYTQDSITTSSDGFLLSMTKGTTSLIISGSGERAVSVIASIVTPVE
jgi:hypothetical protein